MKLTFPFSPVFLSDCGSLKGFSGHGCGKRFVISQELVAAARALIKEIDISAD